MIDPKLLRANFEEVIRKLETRGLPEEIAKWQITDTRRRELLQQIEAIRAEKNRLGPDIARAKKEGGDVESLTAQLRISSQKEKELGEALAQAEHFLEQVELLLPNLPDESVPVGRSEADNRVEKIWGEPRDFSFEPKPHWELGESLGILDFERAARLSGARFCVYLADGARLERALISFMLDRHRSKGYKEVMPPLMVRADTMLGSGQLPKFEADLFKTSTEVPYYLIPTAEVVLCNLHADEILEASELPIRYTAYTPCFRAEAGSYGKDVRGLIRLHQFNKVELVKICTPETSFNELESLTRDAEGILESLELPYRRVTLSTGDMGLAAAKTHDLEVWLPSARNYREISSCSNTTDFQSRRSKTRYRKGQGEKPQLVHMLNGSGLAVGRTLLAILENFQEQDGSIIIPKVLRPYLDGQERLQKM